MILNPTFLVKKLCLMQKVTKISFAKRYFPGGNNKPPGPINTMIDSLSKQTPKPPFSSLPKTPNQPIGSSGPQGNSTQFPKPSTVAPNSFKPSFTKSLTFDSTASKIGSFPSTPNIPIPPTISANNADLAALLTENTKNFKNINDNTFNTKINNNTTASNLSAAELIEELKKRGLIKTDVGQTTSNILDKNNNTVPVGETKNGIKLTQLGQAYAKQSEVNIPSTTANITVNNIDNLKFIVALPPKATDKTFIESGEQKHLLVVYNKENNNYFAMGYFTSKKSVDKIADMQYKAFENLQEKLDNTPNVKAQHFHKFDTPQRMQPNDINPVKYSQEYLDNINQFTYFKNSLEMFNDNAYKEFNHDGITKEHALALCKEHDKVIANKSKHPLTKDQIKHQELNKEKQHQNNAANKEEKQKQKDMAKKEGLKTQQELKLNVNKNDNEIN